MNTQNVLIIGSTGKVGGIVIDLLQQQPHVAIHAGMRDLSNADRFDKDKVTPVHLDLDDVNSISAAMQGITSVLLLTGYSVDMLKQSKRVIDEAKRAGVQHIVHIGASSNTTAEVAHWGWHRMIEAYIEQQGFDYTHLQPEAFMQNLTAFGWLSSQGLVNLIKDAVWSWVDVADVAALAAAALASPARFKNQVWPLGYASASMSQVADRLSQQLETSLPLQPLDPSDFYEGAIAAGADPAYMACIRDQFELNGAGAIAESDKTFDKAAFKQAVGREPIDWDQHIAMHKDTLLNAIR